MKSQAKCAGLLAAVLLAVVGCSEEDPSHADERKLATAALLDRSDLPKNVEPGRWPFDKDECSPRRKFQASAVAVASAPRYVLPVTSFLHTVGVFDSDGDGESELAGFFSKENNDCVLAEMRTNVLEQTGRPTRGRTIPLSFEAPEGLESRAARFEVTTTAGDRAYFDTIGLRDGKAILVVGYYSRNAPVPTELRERLTRKAARRLASAMDGA